MMQAIPIQGQAGRRQGPRGATLAVALAAGLAAALLAFLLVRGRLATQPAAIPVSVVVAAQDIPARTRLTARMLQVRRVLPADVPNGAASSPSALVGKVALQAIPAGAAVTLEAVTTPSAALGMAFALPPHQRAVTVATDPADGVELFVRPGDSVDILATDEPGSGTAEARTALQNVRLLAVGSQTSPDAPASNSASSSPGASHITVAVTPAQAQILVLAAARGKLHLALRAVDDSGISLLPATPASAITPMPPRPVPLHSRRPKAPMTVPEDEPLPLPPLPVAPLPPASLTMTVIKGSVSQTVTVAP